MKKHDGNSSKLIAKEWGEPYKWAPRGGGSNAHILTKNGPKYGIIQIHVLFGPFDNAKYPQIYIQDERTMVFLHY